MIKNTILKVMESTFCIELPNKKAGGMPTPVGTGFFISPDGWFVTAAHIVMDKNGSIRKDLNKAVLIKEQSSNGPKKICQYVSKGNIFSKLDIALLKVDFEKNSNKEWLDKKTEFPFINVSTERLEIGDEVYSFGYPLSSYGIIKPGELGYTKLSPRATSAIISSNFDTNANLGAPKNYVLDKALNYGNSGGPIIATETGNVHAICSRFQPLIVPQQHIKDSKGNPLPIMIPSLYGVVSSFNDKEIIGFLMSRDIPVK
ncbi:chymotrypsin serine protease, family S1 [Methanococcus vannielii SB]|uniref:Chymotrypsin serine protease, family S1 n=1 Tax=Methanococcus vannielii (strain ATCC 35089 / DSM 1224 / JCM 13029 / OCM 148 / SB) TaxID=406327 RepID=A6UNK3_METVS|nr:serine protease [Methanococcus vannielii]ABR54075.1 chymotrypsin serine protease, family S1 [Methanococcus vannielii SB]